MEREGALAETHDDEVELCGLLVAIWPSKWRTDWVGRKLELSVPEVRTLKTVVSN